MFSWQSGFLEASETIYTAAGSQKLFDQNGGNWCGAECGRCYKLTSTGQAPPGEGTGAPKDHSIVGCP